MYLYLYTFDYPKRKEKKALLILKNNIKNDAGCF